MTRAPFTSLTRRQLMTTLPMAVAGARVLPTGSLAMTQSPSSSSSRGQDAKWGVQLYTVRTQIGTDAAGTLKRLRDIGYSELEVLQTTLATVAPLASSLNLPIVSIHLDGPTARGEGFDPLLAQAKTLGARDVVMPYIPPADRPTTRAGFEAIAVRLSAMARAASGAGLRLCYHNHAFEFGQDKDGTRWLDVLMQGTAAAGMWLQLDVFWATIAGGDPVALLKQYAGRVASVHLKDKDPRAATTLVESQAPRTAFVEVGSGALDFPAILSAARTAGVQHYFVEQDQTPGDPVESLRKSYEYLAGLGR